MQSYIYFIIFTLKVYLMYLLYFSLCMQTSNKKIILWMIEFAFLYKIILLLKMALFYDFP